MKFWLIARHGLEQTTVTHVDVSEGKVPRSRLIIDPLPEFLERGEDAAALLDGLVTVCNTVRCSFQQDNRTHCFSLDPVLGLN